MRKTDRILRAFIFLGTFFSVLFNTYTMKGEVAHWNVILPGLVIGAVLCGVLCLIDRISCKLVKEDRTRLPSALMFLMASYVFMMGMYYVICNSLTMA